MKTHLQRYSLPGTLLVYWSLCFVNRFILHEPPFSADFWKDDRLGILLVTVSVVMTLVWVYTSDSVVQQEVTGMIIFTVVIVHGGALLLPSLWLFYLGLWDTSLLLWGQDYAFALMLFALPVTAFIASTFYR